MSGIQKLPKECLEFYKIEWDEIYNRKLEEINLNELKPSLENMREMIDKLIQSESISNLKGFYNTDIEGDIARFNKLVSDIKNLTDLRQRDTILKETNKMKNRFNFKFGPYLDYIDKLNKQIGAFKEIEAKAQNLTISLQKNIKGVEITKYGKIFQKQADENKKAAYIYLGIMIACLLITGVLAFYLLSPLPEIKEGAENSIYAFLNVIIAKSLLFKIVIISLGAYLIAHFSKVYSAEMNLFNLNIQRANALESHKNIIDSIIETSSENDKEITNNITLELSRAIFSNQETGYLKSSNSNPGVVSQIIGVSKGSNK